MGTLRAIVRLASFIALTLPLMPVQWVLLRLGSRGAELLPMFYHRVLCRLLGLEIVSRGRPAAPSPVLYVSNHVSWLDILVLSTFRPVSFVAKSEVDSWPGFNLLARLQNTVFVERRRTRLAAHSEDIADRLASGHSLLLFAEGTSGDGVKVLPFRSGFFAVCANEYPGGLKVQPVSIAYTRLDGFPTGRRFRHIAAWHGDIELVPHLWRFVRYRHTTVEVTFHPTADPQLHADRKALARFCQHRVADGVLRSITGRHEERAAAAPQVSA